ncbi:hypothetical protein AMTR_s00041p00189930 [Amborella trichopoda]|uniref:Uncharacterized protein n=2 Tax=Amborella trichopoda TaxID=13333 RepID=W1PZD9_AMBTC|nr:hypothetical protein AMTR_s00041p00189930 [Amborella trichopoda]
MTTSAWAKPGAWALESEESESMEAEAPPAAQKTTEKPQSDFPSLALAASAKTSKKKKSQPLSLAEFTTGKQVAYSAKPRSAIIDSSRGLTPDELLRLPTGPRERTAEELERGRGSLGGGFQSYGRDRADRGPRREAFDDDARGGRMPPPPSRADEIDDWGATKRQMAPPASQERRSSNFFSDSQSRADESDNWGASKKSFVPSMEPRRLVGGFENFRERESLADEVDNWTSAKKSFAPSVEPRRSGGGFENYREREGSRVGSRFDSSCQREREEGGQRPRLVLQPRTLPVGDGDGPVVLQLRAKVSNPLGEGDGPVVLQPRAKVSNPFGEARPREEVLAEKGQDWKKIAEQLDSMKIKDTVHKELSDGVSVERGGEGGFIRRPFGMGNGVGGMARERTERSWRKPEPIEVASG